MLGDHYRLDNFSFTLLHECAHVIKHLQNPGDACVDYEDSRCDYESCGAAKDPSRDHRRGIRRETGNYRLFSSLVGYRIVGKALAE
jgi:hypothetical protein